jgi:predicted dehydrogenase
MGRTYAEAIGAIEGLELAALCTRTLDRIADLPGPKFSDHRAMIVSGRVDAVVIATPHWSHPTVAIDALRAGLHVLTDKPLAVHVADGQRMLAAHTDKTRQFGVIFNERTRPVAARIRAMIQSGELGSSAGSSGSPRAPSARTPTTRAAAGGRPGLARAGASSSTRPRTTSTCSSGSRDCPSA